MDSEIAYNKALDYLYSFVDYSLKHSSKLAKADFNLGRMFALMDSLGNPQNKYPIIHVAGTKGKGSSPEKFFSYPLALPLRSASRESVSRLGRDCFATRRLRLAARNDI